MVKKGLGGGILLGDFVHPPPKSEILVASGAGRGGPMQNLQQRVRLGLGTLFYQVAIWGRKRIQILSNGSIVRSSDVTKKRSKRHLKHGAGPKRVRRQCKKEATAVSRSRLGLCGHFQYWDEGGGKSWNSIARNYRRAETLER